MSWAVNVKTLHGGGQVSLGLFSSVFLVAKMHVFQSAFMHLQALRPHFVCACVIRASSWPSQSNACSPHSQRLCESLKVLSCRGEVECYAWPADILGQNMIGKKKVQFVLTCTSLPLVPAVWRSHHPHAQRRGELPTLMAAAAAAALCLAHASSTAGHWLSGTAMPHLLEPANTNTADSPASQ